MNILELDIAKLLLLPMILAGMIRAGAGGVVGGGGEPVAGGGAALDIYTVSTQIH